MGRLGGVLALALSALEAFARNDHCFLDKVNETVLTTRDLLDWPLDPLRPWWTRVVDARIVPLHGRRPVSTNVDEGLIISQNYSTHPGFAPQSIGSAAPDESFCHALKGTMGGPVFSSTTTLSFLTRQRHRAGTITS